MKPLLGCVLSLVISMAAVAQEAPAPVAPKIACDEPIFRFGTRDNSEDVDATFVLRNEGNGTLLIESVKAACGCTVAQITRKEIPPGETGEIKTKLSLRGRRGFQRKTVTVVSNDPQKQRFTLTLEGEAVMELEVRPPQLFFGRIPTYRATTGTVEIVAQGNTNIVPGAIETDNDAIDATLETLEEGRRYRVTVVTRFPLNEGETRSGVRIPTDHPRYPTLYIPVSGYATSGLRVIPPELIVHAGQKPPLQFQVRGELSDPVQVLGVESHVEGAVAHVIPTGFNSFRIEVGGVEDLSVFDGKCLTVKTSLEGREEVEVPIRVVHPSEPPVVVE